MKLKEEIEILKHIRLGTKEVLYYPYNEGKDPLPLRPISTYEMDQSIFTTLIHTESKIASLVVKLKLGLVKPEEKITVSNDGYAKLLKYYDSIDYWIVYYAMKDFQDEWFRKPNYDEIENHPNGFYKIREMGEIHEIAIFVLDASYKSEAVIKDIFTDDLGREIATLVLYLHQPIAKAGCITRLQRDYLTYGYKNLDKIFKGKALDDKYGSTSGVMTVQDLLNRFGVDLDEYDSG